VIQVGDLVDRGPDSTAVLDLVGRYLEEQPDQWIQLAGNHEAQYLPGGTSFWRERLADSDARRLRTWWNDGRMRVAAAVRTTDGDARGAGASQRSADGDARGAGASQRSTDGDARGAGASQRSADGDARGAGASQRSADGDARGAGASQRSTDGDARGAGASQRLTDGGDVLLTHAGLTVDAWRALGEPPTAAGAAMLLNERPEPLIWLRDGLTAGGLAGPLWAEAGWELYEPWMHFYAAGGFVPFDQTHGHSSVVRFGDRMWRCPGRVQLRTTVDWEARHTRVRIGGRTFTGVDPEHGRTGAERWRPLVLEGAQVAPVDRVGFGRR
jgi:hypothetical protein